MVMMMVPMVVAAAIVIMVMMMVPMVVAAAIVIIVVMVVMVVVLLLQPGQLPGQGGLPLHSVQQLCPGKLPPGGRNNGCLVIVLPQHGHGGIQLSLGDGIGTGENDGRGSLHLVVIELTEVFHIHLDLTGIHHSHGMAKSNVLVHNLLHRADHIGQLAHTGGLNEDPVGMVRVNHLDQSLSEVAHQRAADAAGVHLGDVDARVLQESAVNADLTEFVLNEYQLLPLIALLNHFFDQGRFSGAQEPGVNIDFCHGIHLLYKISTRYYTTKTRL